MACASNVSLLLGNGDGTFQTHVDYGPSGVEVVTRDFNGDGMLDFAVVGGSTVTLFLNQGSGNFGSTTISLTGAGKSMRNSKGGQKPPIIESNFTAIAAADFNGDGKLDLAVSGIVDVTNEAQLEILLGNGDGTFQSPIISRLSGSPIAVADYNGDGFLDLALGNQGFVSVTLGNGDGTFRAPSTYATGLSSFNTLAAGDLTGDSKPDLAVANGGQFSSSNTLTILLNTGQTSASFKLAVNPTSQTVSAGNSTSFTVTAISVNGFNSSVSLTCTGQPSGSTCTAKPASVIPTTSGATATVTVTTSASTPVGTYPLTITGTSGSEQFNVKPTLTVNPAPPNFSISAPSSANPGSVTPGQSATATVTVGSTGGFTGTVNFTCAVSPAPSLAPTCSFNPALATLKSGGQATSTLTVVTTAPTTAVLTRPNFGHGLAPIYAMVFPILE